MVNKFYVIPNIHAYTSSVLDASTGKPAEGVEIRLQQLEPISGTGSVEADIFHPLAKGYVNLIRLKPCLQRLLV